MRNPVDSRYVDLVRLVRRYGRSDLVSGAQLDEFAVDDPGPDADDPITGDTETAEQFLAKRALAEGRIHCDIGLQVALGRELRDLDRLVALGAVSFELFTADVPDAFLHADMAVTERAMAAVAAAGGAVAVSPGDQPLLEGHAFPQAPELRAIATASWQATDGLGLSAGVEYGAGQFDASRIAATRY